jgi:2-(1,2-epoxy-1,2-dihydrophenyl)acetyl-CoA isomerase
VRAVVLTGAGGAFCAGGDVKAMARGRDAALSHETRVARLRERMEAPRLLHEMAKPTIAIIGGAAAGAGLGLALACDFRLMSTAAKLTTAFAKVGLSGDFGASYFLTRLVGPARALELLMLSPVLQTEQALALGLVHRVHAPDALAAQAQAFVETLARGPSVALGYVKQNVMLSVNSDLRTAFNAEALHQVRCMVTEDHAEAAKSFVEKRSPGFVGR